jgi:hypothetical protein
MAKIPMKNLSAMMIEAAINRLASQKTQRDLAREIAFVTGDMLSMLKAGEVKVPFAKIPRIAEVLEIEPALLLRICLCEQWSKHEAVVREIFRGILTEAEREWIEFFAEIGLTEAPVDTDSSGSWRA